MRGLQVGVGAVLPVAQAVVGEGDGLAGRQVGAAGTPAAALS